MEIKIELDIKDFILLCENTDSKKIYNLNINHTEVAHKIFEYIQNGASWENFEIIYKDLKDFNILDLKNLLEEFDDKSIEEYVFTETELREIIKSETFELTDNICDMDSKKLEEVIDIYLDTNDPIVFRNVMKLLTCVTPSAPSFVHNSKERRLKFLSKKVEKMNDNMIYIFDEYFPEYKEDLFLLDIYDVRVKAEAEHISEMFKKYPNYRHD